MSSEQGVALITGALSRCYLSVDDDLDALLAQAEAIQSKERLRLWLLE